MPTMECDRILELLPGRLDGSLEERQETDVKTHLRECPRCAAEEEALKETLALLRNLPPKKAPPELLEGVRRKIAADTRDPAAGKGRLASARIRIPLEAAAVVLLFLLVYGIQKQIPMTDRPAAPPARMETASPSEGTPLATSDAGKKSEATKALPSRRVPKEETAAGKVLAEPAADRSEAVGTGREAPMEARKRTAERPRAAQASLPTVTATRVSTGAEPVVPRGREEERAEAPAPFRVFPAPPMRLLRPMAIGREVILEVAADQRPGLEERILRVVERFGGSIRREWHFYGTPYGVAGGAPIPEGPMLVQLPADSAESFLAELRKLGTIPPGEIPARVDLPAGPTPDLVAYTVRIRVR
jgi:Putative zinc-finger